MVAESLRRGEGSGTVGSLGVGVGRSRGRLSGVRRKESRSGKSKNQRESVSSRPGVVGMVSDGVVMSSPAAAAAAERQGVLLSGVDVGSAESGNEVGEIVDGEGSMEGHKAKLQAMSESLSDLVGRRRGVKDGENGSRSNSGEASPSPSPSPASSLPRGKENHHMGGDASADATG